MTPEKFPQQNIVFAENQPEYLSLPAHLSSDGTVTTCWKLSWQERWYILRHGTLWFQQLTFNRPLQPQRPSVYEPEVFQSF